MKKVIILLALLALSLCAFSCGGGAGSADSPTGENPGVPSIVQLLPSHFIAQTNSSITLHAKVLDGNGVAVPNTPVTFTNLSSPFGDLNPTSANTDSSGLATVTIRSTSPGFATVVAQVNNGVGNLRDKKSVFFTTNDVMTVSMSLDVDSVPGNGIFNETSDFTLFNPPPNPDNTVLILATVFNAGGVPLAGESILWFSDLTLDNVTFLANGTTFTTDNNGQARAVVQVTPESIRNTETHLNIMAFANNGAANMVTLFLSPITVSAARSSITATPAVVAPDGTSTITATIILNTGNPAPDGTTVNFTTTCGTVDPFAQTTGGIATATFTAPSTQGTCTVTGRVAGVNIGSVDIAVTTALTVVPSSYPAVAGAGGAFTFTITGGAPPYIITSSNPSAVFDSAAGDGVWNVAASGGTFIANVSATACPSSVTLTVSDSLGATKTATITIVGDPILISPASATICENTANCGGSGSPTTAAFTISGGVTPYFTTSSNSAVILSPGAANPFTVDAQLNSITADTTITLTVTDGCAVSKTATVTVLNEP